MKLGWVGLLTVLSVFNIQCSKSGSTQQAKKYFVQGDPITFVKGTALSMKDLQVSEIKNLDGYILLTSITLEQRSNPYSDEEMMEEQKGKEEAEIGQVDISSIFNSKEIKSNKKTFNYENTNATTRIKFVENNGVLVATEYTQSESTVHLNPRVQHFSINQDKSMFTLLVYDESVKDNKKLIAFYFTKKFIPTYEKAVGDYDFIAGKNVKIRWAKENVTLNICSSGLASEETYFKSVMRKWTRSLDSKNFDVQVLRNAPPFSDLNTHCVYLVNDYLTSDSEDSINPAAVLPVFTTHIHDSDMFLYEGEVEKVGHSYKYGDTSGVFGTTITHEMGHFLGLGHPVDLFNPKHKTIMSYADNSNEISEHDEESIMELYR